MSIIQSSPEDEDEVIDVQTTTSSVNVDFVVPPNATTITPPGEQKEAREKASAERALKRKERRERNHSLAEDLSKAGDALLYIKDYAGACANYVHATNLWPSNAANYLKLTEAYLKCERYIEATHAATRALSLDPKSLEARYRRGVARLELRLLPAAKTDFTVVLKRDPNHADARASLSTTLKLLDSVAKLGTHDVAEPVVTGEEDRRDVDFDFPHHDSDGLELASRSDSSDCNHVGNGIPCRFYNHQGCARGTSCTFSHAPDEKSVRDNLGKNVCIYYLLSSCKFGDVKCIYAHSKEDLPKTQGWWNDERQIEKVRSVLEMVEKKSKEQMALNLLFNKLQSSEASGIKSGRKKTRGVGEKKDGTLKFEGTGKERNGRRKFRGKIPHDLSAGTKERAGKENELLPQGVKLRDDGDSAHVDLDVLSSPKAISPLEDLMVSSLFVL